MSKVAILRIEDVVVATVHNEMNDKTALLMQEEVLTAGAACGLHGIILDLSLVDMIDSYIAKLLTDTAQMIRMMGVQVCMSGIKPIVALTIVEMGLELGGVPCTMNVNKALVLLSRRASPDRYEQP